jgi:hypothetical protein
MKKFKTNPSLTRSVGFRALRASVVDLVFHHRGTENTKVNGEVGLMGRSAGRHSSVNNRYSLFPLTHKLIPNAQ